MMGHRVAAQKREWSAKKTVPPQTGGTVVVSAGLADHSISGSGVLKLLMLGKMPVLVATPSQEASAAPS